MSVIEVKVPDIGDFKDVEVIEVLVKSGDSVRVEQSLVTVESDKASMEIPSSVAGVVRELKIKLGDRVSEGTLICLVDSPDAAVAPVAAALAKSSERGPAGPVAAAPAIAAAAGGPKAAAGRIDVVVPDIGDFKDVEIIEVLVKPGDSVAVEQSLITVESDKASMEIPSSAAGLILELKVVVGAKVSQGDLIAIVEGAPAQAAEATTQAPVAVSIPAPTQGPIAAPGVTAPVERGPPVDAAAPATPNQTSPPHASPSVRKFARELGVDLSRVTGTGPKERITHDDVRDFVKSSLAAPAVAPAASVSGMSLLPWPSLDFSKFGETELLALSRIKKISGPNLARNWALIPHVTQFDEADITELEAFRKETNEALAKQGIKVTMLAFVIKACVAALAKFPAVNSSISADGASLIMKKYFHIGFAADTPQGLVVPVIRDCDRKGVAAIAAETAALAAKAREGKLSPADMQGASFTISSLGGIGGTAFTPIINAPEVAILGLSKSELKPRWNGSEFVPRLMLPISFSYDHRAIDGAQGARFTNHLGELLQDMRRVLL